MKKIVLSVITLVLVIVAAGCGQKSEQAVIENAVEAEDGGFVDAYGLVKANDERNIVINFPASVEEIYVKNGQKVKKGDPLAKLDISEFKSQIRTKSLELAREKNELEDLKKSYSYKNPELKKLLNDLKTAEAQYNKAIKELETHQELFNVGSISRSELEQFKTDVDIKKKDVENIKFAIDSLKFNQQPEIKAKSLGVDLLELELEAMISKLNKEYISSDTVVSNIQNGVVYDIYYKQGDILSPEVKLMGIMNLDSLIVEAEVSEEFIKDIKTGNSAKIIPVADRSREYNGKVTFIPNKAIQKNGEAVFPVEISVTKKDGFLVPELNVDVRIEVK